MSLMGEILETIFVNRFHSCHYAIRKKGANVFLYLTSFGSVQQHQLVFRRDNLSVTQSMLPQLALQKDFSCIPREMLPSKGQLNERLVNRTSYLTNDIMINQEHIFLCSIITIG